MRLYKGKCVITGNEVTGQLLVSGDNQQLIITNITVDGDDFTMTCNEVVNAVEVSVH